LVINLAAGIVIGVISQPLPVYAQQCSIPDNCKWALANKLAITQKLLPEAKEQCRKNCEATLPPDTPTYNGRSECYSGCESMTIKVHNLLVNF
jgi:hypothetical protein